jgi:hypothetical protein
MGLTWLWLACGQPVSVDVVTGALTGVSVAPAPLRLEDGVWIEVRWGGSGRAARIRLDGRYVEVDPAGRVRQVAPRSLYDRGVGAVTDAGLRRLGAAVDAATFFELPAKLEVPPIPPDARLPDGSIPVTQELSIAVARPTGAHRVTVAGDVRLIDSLGPLGPVYAAIDREVLGGWMNR